MKFSERSMPRASWTACRSCRRCSASVGSVTGSGRARTRPVTRSTGSSFGGWTVPSTSRSCAATARRTAAARPAASFSGRKRGSAQSIRRRASRTPETEAAGASLETLIAATQVGTNEAGQTLFSCQATELTRASKGLLPWWEPNQYVQDVASGNSTVFRVIRALLVGLFNRFQRANARLLPRFCLIQRLQALPVHRGKGGERKHTYRITWPTTGGDRRDQEPRRDLRDAGRERHDARTSV